MTMTPEELRAMAEAATKRPWFAVQPDNAYGWWVVSTDKDGFNHVDSSGDGGFCEANARLIEAAPTLARDLADALEELARLREAWSAWHKANVERSGILVCGPASAAEYSRLSEAMNRAADVFNFLTPPRDRADAAQADAEQWARRCAEAEIRAEAAEAALADPRRAAKVLLVWWENVDQYDPSIGDALRTVQIMGDTQDGADRWHDALRALAGETK